MTLRYVLKNKPIITSLVAEEDLEELIKTTSNIAFILTGNIFSLKNVSDRLKEAGKLIFVHIDLMEGIGKDKWGIQYLAEEIGIDGVVTTRSNIIIAAKHYGLITIQRLFVFDSVSLDKGINVIKSSQPDAIEVLPGMVIPRVIKKIHKEVDVQVIAGGLIIDLQDVQTALESGAIGISTSTKELWHWQDKENK